MQKKRRNGYHAEPDEFALPAEEQAVPADEFGFDAVSGAEFGISKTEPVERKDVRRDMRRSLLLKAASAVAVILLAATSLGIDILGRDPLGNNAWAKQITAVTPTPTAAPEIEETVYDEPEYDEPYYDESDGEQPIYDDYYCSYGTYCAEEDTPDGRITKACIEIYNSNGAMTADVYIYDINDEQDDIWLTVYGNEDWFGDYENRGTDIELSEDLDEYSGYCNQDFVIGGHLEAVVYYPMESCYFKLTCGDGTVYEYTCY